MSEQGSAGRHVVSSAEELEEVIGTPLPQVVDKVIDHLDHICRDFIAASPTGDPPGFVRVLDDHHLAIPDRPGNRRADTFHNLLRDDRIALIFLVPGTSETLRVSGRARIVRDSKLLESMAIGRREPRLATVVQVERVFMHSPKCMIRSQIWKSEAWPDSEGLAHIGEAMIAHADLDVTPDELFAEVARAGLTDLY